MDVLSGLGGGIGPAMTTSGGPSTDGVVRGGGGGGASVFPYCVQYFPYADGRGGAFAIYLDGPILTSYGRPVAVTEGLEEAFPGDYRGMNEESGWYVSPVQSGNLYLNITAYCGEDDETGQEGRPLVEDFTVEARFGGSPASGSLVAGDDYHRVHSLLVARLSETSAYNYIRSAIVGNLPPVTGILGGDRDIPSGFMGGVAINPVYVARFHSGYYSVGGRIEFVAGDHIRVEPLEGPAGVEAVRISYTAQEGGPGGENDTSEDDTTPYTGQLALCTVPEYSTATHKLTYVKVTLTFDHGVLTRLVQDPEPTVITEAVAETI